MIEGDMTNALFILNSPFQAICAVEAVSHYKVQNPTFFIFDCKDSLDSTKSVVNKCSGKIYIMPNVGTVRLVRYILSSAKAKFDVIFMGDFYSYSQYLLAIMLCKSHSKLIYLDDGNSTLSMSPPVCRQRCTGLSKRRLSYLMLDLCAKSKHISTLFFSIYNLSSLNNIKFERNNLSHLKNNNLSKGEAVYIIGTNSSILSFQGGTYLDLLEKTISYIIQDYPGKDIYYCPHRRDTNDYSQFLANNKVLLYNTKVSVEVDFLEQHISPISILGFASTALLTLKSLFPESKVFSVHFELSDSNETIKSIEAYYKNNNIEILYL